MIPYIEHPVLRLGPVAITAFEALVFAAVLAGLWIAARRLDRAGFDRSRAQSLLLWTTGTGFVGSHLFDALLYRPEVVRADPLELLRVWGTMSSFGGLIGGVAGALLGARLQRLSRAELQQLFDALAFAFSFAWIFGRAGCALAHDHLGVASEGLLAVRFPGGARYDLGLLELFWTVALAALFAWLDRRPRAPGAWPALFLLLYSPVRFALDTLRTGDERYLGLTPGQYASIAATLAGAALLARALRTRPLALENT